MRYSYLCIYLLTLAPTALPQSLGEPERHQVIVVGAGVSGFAAATTLLANNINDVIILEASNRIGGRIHTVEFGGISIDMGAAIDTGENEDEDENAYELVGTSHDISSNSSLENVRKNIYVDISGHKYNTTFIGSIMDQASNILSKVPGDFHGTVAEYFYTRLNEILASHDVDPGLKEAITLLATLDEESDSAVDNLEQLGLLEENTPDIKYEENEADLSWKWKTSGFKTIFDILSKKLPVMEKISFGKEVWRIDHGEGSGEVVVRCADGSSYKADHVIVTVSLGVLKKHAAEMFHPPLPQHKTDAIRTFGFRCVGKLFLLFPSRWWPSDFKAIIPLFSKQQLQEFKDRSTHGYWTAYSSKIKILKNHDRMMRVFFSGQSCRTMEKLTDQEAADGMVELLNYLIGKQFQIPRPENIARSDWWSNPYTLGAYGSSSQESDRLHVTRDTFGEPLKHGDKPVVMFAGEATDTFYSGTIHGALNPGRREAYNLLKYVSTHSNDHV